MACSTRQFSTGLQILVGQPPNFMCRAMFIDHEGRQPLHPTRSAAMFDQDFNGEVDCRGPARTGHDAAVTYVKLVFNRLRCGEHVQEFRPVMRMDGGTLTV